MIQKGIMTIMSFIYVGQRFNCSRYVRAVRGKKGFIVVYSNDSNF